jgi:hypothetical protein
MNINYLLTGILAALFLLMTLIQVVTWLSRRRRDRAARAYLAQHPLPGRSYEVGSPEYHAQIVAMIHQTNEQLEPQGKRIPERVTIEIIKQIEESN